MDNQVPHCLHLEPPRTETFSRGQVDLNRHGTLKISLFYFLLSFSMSYSWKLLLCFLKKFLLFVSYSLVLSSILGNHGTR